MIANGYNANGHAPKNGHARTDILQRLIDQEERYTERQKSRDPQSTYLAGDSDRMNPVPKGIDPLGTDADYHYRTERNYFLMVERSRHAVRNHGLVEQGINRLIANLKLGENTLEVDSGDLIIDDDLGADWLEWCSDKKRCDFEQARNFQQIDRQSFFNQVVDGDILHVPLNTGQLQTFEGHQIRTPFGHRPTGLTTDGIIHGTEVTGGRITGRYVTPQSLSYFQSITRRYQCTRIPEFDDEGNKTAFWLGFRHRYYQRRGISRLSPPREAMCGFDDLNYAHIKSSLRRALISYLMQSVQQPNAQLPGGVTGGKLPQAGARYQGNDVGLGLESAIIEHLGEPAQVFKAPENYSIDGWNANLPGTGFFEHASLLLTMLAVNLDLPLMFLLLDGSLVNFHGGRMTFDQAKMRFAQLQKDQIEGLWNPTFAWRIRRKLIPGSPDFDRALFAAVQRGTVNPFKFCFHRPAWPYVKPMEDAAAEKLAETSNLRSLREIYAARGDNFDKKMPEILFDRTQTWREALTSAEQLRTEFPDAGIDTLVLAEKLIYPEQVQLSITADVGSDEAKPASKDDKSKKDGGSNAE